MRGCVVVLLLAAGCGRIDFDELTTGDSQTSDGVAAGCWASWRSGAVAVQAPRMLDELSTGVSLGDPSLSGDALTLYYTRADASVDLHVATRAAIGDRWTPVGAISELDMASDDTKLTVTSDGLTGVFASNRASTDIELFMTSRSATTDPWGTPTRTPLTSINTPQDDYDPDFTADGLHLYFAPNPGTGQQIVSAVRSSLTATFVTERVVDELAMGTTYSDPTLSPDELVIAYAANSAAMLYYATRASRADRFGPPVTIPMVNGGTGRQTDAELSADGCELYFSSTRTGTKELYVATIQP